MSQQFNLPEVSGLLPNRAIQVKRSGLASRWLMLALCLVFAVCAAATAYIAAPGLYADYRIKQDPLVIEDYDITSGTCKTKKMITDCDAKIAYLYEGEIKRKAINIVFVDFSDHDYEAEVVVEKANPDNATLSLAIEKFWVRFGLGLALLAVFVFASYAFGKQFLQITRTLKAVGKAQVLELAWVKITSSKKQFGRVVYQSQLLAKQAGKINKPVSIFSKKEDPFVYDDGETDEALGLVVVAAQAPMPILLDDQFERLELTDAERAKIMGAFYTQSEEEGSASA